MIFNTLVPRVQVFWGPMTAQVAPDERLLKIFLLQWTLLQIFWDAADSVLRTRFGPFVSFFWRGNCISVSQIWWPLLTQFPGARSCLQIHNQKSLYITGNFSEYDCAWNVGHNAQGSGLLNVAWRQRRVQMFTNTPGEFEGPSVLNCRVRERAVSNGFFKILRRGLRGWRSTSRATFASRANILSAGWLFTSASSRSLCTFFSFR